MKPGYSGNTDLMMWRSGLFAGWNRFIQNVVEISSHPDKEPDYLNCDLRYPERAFYGCPSPSQSG